MPATPYQIMCARRLLGLTVIELSGIAGVCRQTLKRMEAGRSTQTLTRVALRKALEEAGAAFLADGNVIVKPRDPMMMDVAGNEMARLSPGR